MKPWGAGLGGEEEEEESGASLVGPLGGRKQGFGYGVEPQDMQLWAQG